MSDEGGLSISQGLQPELIQTEPQDGYQLRPDQITDAGLDGVMVASPANPTGTMLNRDRMAGLMDAAREAGTTFISDEIYHGLHYGERAVSALEIGDDAIVINSFSKYFSMAGWRLGWIVSPDDMASRTAAYIGNMFLTAPSLAQHAGLVAMDFMKPAKIELPDNLANVARWYAEISARPSATA